MNKLEEQYRCSSLNMIVELTNACNLRCKYCFENHQTEKRISSVMNKDVLKKSIDFLLKDRTNAHLTFFGGEPLLCKELIEFGIKYGNEMARKMRTYISYSIVTNGTELDDDIIFLLNTNDVNIVYSFDGNEFSQNKYRPFFSGDKSYDVVLKNLKKLLKSRKDERYGHLIVRPTITSDTIELLVDIYNELIKIGCKEISFSLVSAENFKDYAIKSTDLDKLREAYKKMLNIYYYELLGNYSYNKFFESILERIESNSINKEFCDCGKRYIAIDVNGNVYPCEGFIGVKEFMMGDVISGMFNDNWVKPKCVDENVECKKCWARYLCGGSCYHEAWMRTGMVDGRDKLVCETYRIAFEFALKLHIKMKNENLHIKKIINESFLPERTVPVIKDISVKKIDENTIYAIDLNENRFITMNETAQRVFQLCDGTNTIQDICNVIMNEFECEFDIYSDISQTINSFLNEGIIRLTV